MNSEEWRPVPEFESDYEVSNRGFIRSLPRQIKSARGYEYSIPGGVLSPDKSANGTHRVTVYRDTKPFKLSVPRVVAVVFLGPPPPGKNWVLHWDDNRDNNHVSNLRWGDVKDNVRDAIRNQKHPGAAIVCPKGHPYRDSPSSGKRRRCSICELEVDRREYWKRVREGLPKGDPRHGSYSGYRAGCREVCCTDANSRYKADYYKRRKEQNALCSIP